MSFPSTETKYIHNMLDDELWSELSLDEAAALVNKHRVKAINALDGVKAHLKLLKDRAKRNELYRKRRSIVTFIDLCNQRSGRIREARKLENVELSNFEVATKFDALKRAIRAHRDVTTNSDSTDAELDFADEKLYETLKSVTGEIG